MKSILSVLSALMVIGLAYWAYAENYATQSTMSNVDRLHRQIGAAQARKAVLKAEWAYLNRPDRLQDLVDLNFDRLGLLPLAPEQFGLIEQVAYPPVAPAIPLTLDGAIEVMAPEPTAEVQE